MISHLIGNISNDIIATHRHKFMDEKECKQKIDSDITKLLQIFPDHSSKYCIELLKYFNNKFDIAVNAVLESIVPRRFMGQ